MQPVVQIESIHIDDEAIHRASSRDWLCSTLQVHYHRVHTPPVRLSYRANGPLRGRFCSPRHSREPHQGGSCRTQHHDQQEWCPQPQGHYRDHQ